MEKFSDSLPLFTNDIENPEIQDSLKSLCQLQGDQVKILDWGDSRIAIPIEINIDLPSLGNFDDLDIREKEPVIFVFDLINYPVSAPRVYTDRLDFPKNNLAHLYVAVNNRPPAFCYVRGNADEWYANKRIEDLVIRISNWLRDGATGELTENGEQYEPLRLEGYSGSIIYDYDTLLTVVANKAAFEFGDKFSIVLFERPSNLGRYTYKFVRPITDKNALTTIKEVDEERKKDKEDVTRKKYYYGYVLWSEEDVIRREYEVNIPRSWDEFKLFCEYYHIKYKEFEKFITTYSKINEYIYFPVIIGIRRPSQLIGYSSNVEFINLRFKVTSSDIEQEKIVNNVPIDMLSHNQPLTKKLAGHISGLDKISDSKRNVIFGCGAIGSKMIMHLARSGQTNLTLIDPDYISPHNLVRHTLFGEDVGHNKAEALAEKIEKIYPYENTKIISGTSFKDGLIGQKETFEKYDWVLDFTASEAFFNRLSTLRNIDNNHVVSASISDFGNLGIMYKEGNNRNPRLDDLQVYLFSLAENDLNIRNWLKNEQASAHSNLTVHVGVGCNSETTVLSDHKISSHASYFSGVLQKEMSMMSAEGKIYLNRIIDSKDYRIETQVLNVKPFDMFQAVNNTNWEIRFKQGIVEQLTKEFTIAGKNETGGVFVGVCNYKTKTIHITGSIKAPLDSKGSTTQFVRGQNGLANEISAIEKSSGGQIGYVGEWHTHPDGPNCLSKQDMESVKKHKEECSNLQPPLPVFLSIITPTGIFPYVF